MNVDKEEFLRESPRMTTVYWENIASTLSEEHGFGPLRSDGALEG